MYYIIAQISIMHGLYYIAQPVLMNCLKNPFYTILQKWLILWNSQDSLELQELRLMVFFIGWMLVCQIKILIDHSKSAFLLLGVFQNYGIYMVQLQGLIYTLLVNL